MHKKRDTQPNVTEAQPSPHDEVTDTPELSALRAEMEERLKRHTYLQSLPLTTPTRCPKARDDEAIVAQEVLDEYVVYDLHRHKVHSLNPTAATVWQWCDGETTLAVMATRLGTALDLDREAAEPLMYLAFGSAGAGEAAGGPGRQARGLSERPPPAGAPPRGRRPAARRGVACGPQRRRRPERVRAPWRNGVCGM